MKNVQTAQPLSAKAYVFIALIGLLIGIGLLVFYIEKGPQLVQSDVGNKVYYLLLFPWGLACAAFLFGAMRSYARFTHKHLGSVLELGGPVVLFCLVVVGGFKLVPQQGPTFDVTARAHSQDDRDPFITSGKITLELGTVRRVETIDAAGEANFKGVPITFKSATLRVLPQVDGYEQQWQQLKLTGNVLDVSLVRAAQPTVTLIGSIIPPPQNPGAVKVFVDGQKAETSPDEFGRFSFLVNGKTGDRVRLKIFAGKKLVYDDTQTLPGPINLKLHNLK